MRNFVRFCLRIWFRLCKIKIEFRFNLQDLPSKGVYISNHVSYFDPIVLFAFLPGNPILVLHGDLYRNKMVRFFLAYANIFKFDNLDAAALKILVGKVQEGRLALIFPEGRITSTGGLMKIYESAGLLADKADAPIIPIWIDGLQYSYFAKTAGKLPHRWCPRTKITVEAPRPLKLKDELRHRREYISNEIYSIMLEQGFEASYSPAETLFSKLVKIGKVNAKIGFKRPFIIEDIKRQPNTYRDLLVKSYILGKALVNKEQTQEPIGIILPNVVATVCSFLGFIAYGAVPVMINFTAGIPNVLSMCQTVRLKRIVTSLAFVHSAGLKDLTEALKNAGYEIIYLEELGKSISLLSKIAGLLRYKVRRLPYKAKGTDSAAVLFTSGSEGAPKAVVLSHNNLVSNIAQIQAFQRLNRTDLMFNCLPMFHSFGLVLGTLYPLCEGARVFLYPSPLHFRVISDLLYELRATCMLGTDTFFRSYAKISHPFDFSSVKLCYAAAEAVKLDTRNILGEHLGMRLMEAYGSTECSPAIAGNNAIFNKFGTVGKLCPGMQMRVDKVDGIATGGELVVKGPNIMKGYMLAENPGVLVPVKDGWYHTGDVIDVDEIGFIKIKDRIKRFAKIGGEMVSLLAVETMARKALGEFTEGLEIGVVAIPHESKGEQLVLVTNNKDTNLSVLKEYAQQQGLPELYLPRIILYKEKLPLFATGKTDNVSLKKYVMEELKIS